MRKLVAALVLSALALGSATSLAAKPGQTGEEKLAKLLDGRVAGEPRSCMPTYRNTTMRVIDKTAIVYDAGGTIWVNRTADPEKLDRDDTMVVGHAANAPLCRGDSFNMRDPGTPALRVGFLRDFVPFRKVES